jgi:hypothetical protein
VLPQVSEPSAQESLTIDPAPKRWAELLAQRTSRPLVIMVGHQAEFWHPGILAKYFAANAAAKSLARAGREVAVHWLVVDQDSNDPSRIAFPARAEGGLAKVLWKVPFQDGGTASNGFGDTPTAALPPLNASTIPDGASPALACVETGLARIAESLRAHAREPNAASQVASVLRDLLAPYARPNDTLYGSQLFRLGVFPELIERMRSDPAACTRAYNAAVALHPHAHVRALIDEPGRTELPLWRMPEKPGQPRRPVFAADLPNIDPSHLAPRALLMTAIVRLGHCDLLIHGTGGGLYDKITEAWLSRWLPGRTLAPTAVVTATRLLPFDIKPPSPEAIAKARWLAHHARHDPALLGDAPAAERKQQILHDLRTARSRGHLPALEFGDLCALLTQVRQAHAPQLAALQSAATDALHQRELAEIVYERTWPFPLYPEEAIRELKSSIDAAFA